MATSRIALHHLPFETLQEIAVYLDYTHRPSLYAFGLANKTCRSATLLSVFRNIYISVQSREKLRCDLEALVKILSDADSARHVRRLHVKGFLNLDPDDSLDPNHDEREQRLLRAGGILEVLGSEEPVVHGTFIQDEAVDDWRDENSAWAPVVDLVKIIPHLAELVYDCRNQFPPGLLDVLHKSHPQCRLSHLQFQLRSLRREVLNPHELAVATSPCLHSISVNYVQWDSNGEFDYHYKAILDLVAGLAPNLKEVRAVQLIASPTGQSSHNLEHVERQPWRGLSQATPGRRIGSLTSLSLVGAMNFRPRFLRAWNNSTDWSSLHHLVLGGGIESHTGVTESALTWMLENCSFVRLKTLRIRLDHDDDDIERPNYTDIAMRFFKALEPLEELSVSGSLEPQILNAILSRHGHSLKKLSIRPFESYFASDGRHVPMVCGRDQVLQIQAQCPVLEDLAIPIKRTKSDAREAATYRSLSELATVQNLMLILDCSDWEVARSAISLADPPPSFDEEDRRFWPRDQVGCAPLRRGHVRDTFLNCAVDEKLARSIWATVCRDKVGARLGSLKIYTTGGGSYGLGSYWPNIQAVCGHLSRSWLIEGSVRDDEDWGAISVRELGRRAREARDEDLSDEKKYIYREQSAASAPSAAGSCSPEDILRRIWPCEDGNKDWRDVWCSFPPQE